MWQANSFCKTVEAMFCRIYSEFSRSIPRHRDLASLQAEISNAVYGDGGESCDSESSDGKKLYQFSKYYRVRWIGKLACIEPILQHLAALLHGLLQGASPNSF